MNRKYIEIVSFKGGAGKSFVAYFLSKELSKYKSTLVIDRGFVPTISYLYGVNADFANYLMKFVSEPYFTTKGNLTVVNFMCSNNLASLNVKDLEDVYSKFLDHEIVIVDNPNLPDMCYNLHREASKVLNQNENVNVVAVATPPEFLIEKTKKDLVEAKKLMKINPIAVVINKDLKRPVDSMGIENLAPLFRIPFDMNYMTKPWNKMETPKPIVQLSKLIMELN
ncbi:MAG: hypothetical protein JZD40_02335 [Sulfolobus sp.]|nr:hypothetical protein [Sulfolobus sp.]